MKPRQDIKLYYSCDECYDFFVCDFSIPHVSIELQLKTQNVKLRDKRAFTDFLCEKCFRSRIMDFE